MKILVIRGRYNSMGSGFMVDQLFITDLTKNYTKVFNYTGGHPNIETCLLIAAQYTFASKEYSGVSQQKIIDRIRNKDPFYSPFWNFCSNVSLQYKLATYLILSGDIEGQLVQARRGEELLDSCGFDKSPYRSLASFFIADTSHSVRVKALHKELKKRQRWLTRDSDLPYIVLLTKNSNGPSEKQAQSIYEYYQALSKFDFKAGDDLQALAQILILYKVDYVEELALYVKQLKREFEQRNVKIKRRYYPYLGALAIIATDTQLVQKIAEYTKVLEESSVLKGMKDLAFMIAVQKFVQEYKEHIMMTLEQFKDTSLIDSFIDFMDVLFNFPSVAFEGIGSLLEMDFPF